MERLGAIAFIRWMVFAMENDVRTLWPHQDRRSMRTVQTKTKLNHRLGIRPTADICMLYVILRRSCPVLVSFLRMELCRPDKKQLLVGYKCKGFALHMACVAVSMLCCLRLLGFDNVCRKSQ